MSKYLILNPRDNVGIVITPPKTSVPKGHKIALKRIEANSPIIKFGYPIGLSKRAIAAGEHVHIHNMKFSDKIKFLAPHPGGSKKFYLPDKSLPGYFNGFLRSNGQAGTRNYIIVASTVSCSAGVAREVAGYFRDKSFSSPGIHGIVPLVHASGCAQAKEGYGYTLLKRTLSGWLDHPNVVGGVVIGLGCETLAYRELVSGLDSKRKKFFEFFNIQDVGGTKRAVKAGIKRVKQIRSKLPAFRRKRLPLSLLKVALNCGGSDSYSGLTANPALGVASDILVSKGGAVALGEIPECWGLEKLLLSRCRSKGDRDRLKRIFSWWVDYGRRNQVNMNSNLSTGNIAGGITTILEKSLGAFAKCGSFPIRQVVDYSQPITQTGVVLMNTPGFDPVSVTGLIAGGCNLVAFTTGRGSVYVCSLVPTIKISTNSDLYKKLKDDIDIDAGEVLAKQSPLEAGGKIFNLLITVAGGTKTKSEKQGMISEGFVPWPAGEVL